ncbi:hypothetical protein [Nostoc sp. FACHB-145]|uniref:hypothetical protein n=1 Tax=Nostoc sp. FACHB-145 TaxID=2692836 RepID=UPI001683710C|nr:hypothetical protein [Nostoc sp. FACHB-145]MBD2471409.1 hypothetical protein [Nostoc sp. FACHB-145]
MPNWRIIEASFLHLTQPQQLGELAACLARLKSWVQNSAKREIVPVLLEESLLYLSLIQQNSEINHVELNQLQDTLQNWKLNWVSICDESTQTANITDVASTWSERVLAMSGLLTSQSMSA